MTRTLLVHIGTGKTGSTAIQHALATSAKLMRDHGIVYWGLNLEECDQTSLLYPWQKKSGTALLQKMNNTDARDQLQKTLTSALDGLMEGQLAIWSNESICERPSVYIPVIQNACEDKNVNPVVVCYVRNHVSYAASAYKQWGVKHKTYPGRIQGFSEWVNNSISFLSYGKCLSLWDEAFASQLHLVNYDAIRDVVKSFADFIPDPSLLKIPEVRFNSTPPKALLAFYALHNNQFESPVSPADAEALLHRYHLLASNHDVLDLRSIFPDPKALAEAEKLLREDTDLVNNLLDSRGQLGFRQKNIFQGSAELQSIDVHASLLSILFKMLMMQGERIAQLENQNTEISTDEQ